MDPVCSRLVLGTAQLGQEYGVANRTGMPSSVAATGIVRTAWDLGIETFDTAHTYGRSEEMLGLAFADIGIAHKARVISKFPVDQSLDADAIRESVRAALATLGVSHLDAMLFHRDTVIESWRKIGSALNILLDEGTVRHFGVSTYAPDRALAALDCEGLDVVQVPGSLLDRRFDTAGFMDLAAGRGVQVYLRSVFLQGLLLMDPSSLPAKVAFAEDIVRRTVAMAAELGLDRDEMALCYARDRWPHAAILIGAETPEQVRRNTALWKRPALSQATLAAIEKGIGEVDERVVRPDTW